MKDDLVYVKNLGVKEWFSDKNHMVDYVVNAVLEVREKAVKITMTSRGKTYFYWCPKSCLEIRTDVKVGKDESTSLEGKTLDEVIEMYKLKVTIQELIRMNQEDFYDYC